jgi:IS5 family transposase
VERWIENPYWQYFSGMEYFQALKPFDPSDFVHFRKRVGKKGAEKIFEISVKLHGKDADPKEVVVDTTVQEKNITFPTDFKLHRRIIGLCRKIASEMGIELRQSYTRVVKKCTIDQRFRNHPKNRKKALHSARKVKTIAGRLVRELERKLSEEMKQELQKLFSIFHKILTQKQNDKDKIYSVHEPDVQCIAKGKEYKKYEFGNKVSVVVTKTSGIIVGIESFEKNIYDGHTLPQALQQVETIVGKRPEVAIVDRGYQGRQQIDGTEIIRAKPLPRSASQYEKQKLRKRMQRRASIEPVISHLKHDYGMLRNYLKGMVGDSVNCILAAAAFNFRKYLRKLRTFLLKFISAILFFRASNLCFYH